MMFAPSVRRVSQAAARALRPRAMQLSAVPKEAAAPEWRRLAGLPEVTADGVAIVRFDAKGEKMNSMQAELFDELTRGFDELKQQGKQVKGIVFISSKPDNFIAGADIKMLEQTQKSRDFAGLKKMTMDGHARFAELQKMPMVAAIHGACLGGGLEFALKCDWRVATTAKETALGLPEVMLGLLPGWGGTYALPKLIGLMDALPLMLKGSKVDAKKAKRLGLVDVICDLPSLERVAVEKCTALVNKTDKMPDRKKSWKRWVSELPPVADYICKKAKAEVQKSTRGKYPAPFEIIDCVRNGLKASSPSAAFDREADGFLKLAATSESSALLGLFQGQTASKKHRFLHVAAEKPSTICVLGAGLMGAGIAQISAAKGMAVVLKDRDASGVAKGVKYVDDNWAKEVQRKKITSYEKNLRTSLVQGFHDGAGSSADAFRRRAASVDVFIEAVFEDIELKHAVLKSVEPLMKDDAVFATNTSAIPISRIAAGAARPERVVGLHYFSPVPQMPLLEVIPHAGSSDEAMARAFAVGIRQGKTCIEVKDVPGFYVNRAIAPMMAELPQLFADGVTPAQMEKAALDLGFPVGPMTLSDEVGADVAYKASLTMIADPTMGKRMGGSDPSLQKEMIDRGWLGRKTGKGFFVFEGKKKTPNAELEKYIATHVKQRDANVPVEVIQDRYICRFINEAVKCLEDGVIRTPTDGDVGAVFGVGFPPFHGGPFKLLDAVGAQMYVDKMEKLVQKYGDRFEPCQLLKDHAKSGKKFHA
ncbi:ClpP/crotonase-like domain-containing protein [Pelagophyceae sp. CCMP2097]|nr:ClpP/crotonase-like domain-containing protein [Pelagophyceae sp. CCMP2097]